MTSQNQAAEFTPAYLRLGIEELRSRAHKAVSGLVSCRVCPRNCEVNRLEDKWSACKTGRYAVVASVGPHLGEEDCLRGWKGSGTIFFGHCNLRCVFCQNYDISQGLAPGPRQEDPGTGKTRGRAGRKPDELARLMLALQDQGCHNINLVTPEHVVPQVLEALVPAVEGGLRLPLVYNTSAYDSMESLRILDGVVDIYMPDLKLFDSDLSKRYLKAEDYPEVAKAALREMHRQVGSLSVDASGLATRGVLIRHLVLPGFPDETRSILEWIASELGPETYVNVMAQYRPAGRVGRNRYPELNIPLGSSEFSRALETAREVGLTRLDERF
jgi:putative pyruvate formate lyase activating enzyme